MEYSNEELGAIYELGRLYFEMGYFAPAERIFSGLAVVDNERTAARLALGVVKLETGLFREAAAHFRLVLQSGHGEVQAKLGLCAAAIGMEEPQRAQSILAEISKMLSENPNISSEIRRLYEAFVLRLR